MLSKPSLRVMLVEADSKDLEAILNTLKKQWTVESMVNTSSLEAVSKALDDLAKNPLDVILCDFNLPLFTALAVLELLKIKQLDVPCIIVSGAITEEAAMGLIKAGADDYVMKSNLLRLIPTVERSLRERALRLKERELRMAAEKAIEERERMLSIVSHDIKNPLSALRLGVQMLKKLIPMGATSIDGTIIKQFHILVDRMNRSVERTLSMVTDILDMTKVEAGRFVIERAEGNAFELLHELMDMFEPLAAQKNIKLQIKFPEESTEKMATAMFDRERVFQALMNLVGNALKFTPEGGSITVELQTTIDALTFRVTDTGPGIPPKYLSRIFERFWQMDSSKTGMGLGLSIVKGIAQAHGGETWASSSYKNGKGSSFYFTIPRALDLF